MGLVIRKTQNLNDLFQNQLNTLYGLETESLDTLNKMAGAATSPAVRKELEAAAAETRTHATRLDEVFKAIGSKPDSMRCGCVDGLLRDCRDAADSDAEINVRDASLVAMAQAIQQNEIARYQAAHGWASSLKQDKAGTLLKQTIDEETASSSRLAALATTVNESAVHKVLA
tara:strand:- start:362 stop:877 length:516 start_codon:yes stop_codon:yes gene_type:complete